jgi:hypothetical protein
VKLRWRDVDPSALYLVPIFGMRGREWSGALQDAGQGAWKALQQVDDHKHRRWEIRRQASHEAYQSVDPSR